MEECSIKLDETKKNCKFINESLRLKEILLSASPYKLWRYQWEISIKSKLLRI